MDEPPGQDPELIWRSSNMSGFSFDGMLGYWGTRSAVYYLIARFSIRPELTVDEVFDEYCTAFGEAAPGIREYLGYWERFTEQAAYLVAVGGEVPKLETGLYGQWLTEKGLGTHPLPGSFTAIPLYIKRRTPNNRVTCGWRTSCRPFVTNWPCNTSCGGETANACEIARGAKTVPA